jgi:F-type H+-transporting ATPase subunit delta
MANQQVAARYAKSLLDLAQEQGTLATIKEDMDLLATTMAGSRDLRLLLRNPIVKHDKKLSILKAVFQGKVSDMLLRFFQIVTSKNREDTLEFIGSEFLRQTGLTQISLTEKVDASLIGGFVLRVGDRQIDDSVRGGLRRLRTSLTDKTYTPSLN